MWIEGDGEEEGDERMERWRERETRPPGTDVVRQAMRQRASEPPALGLGTAWGGSERRWSKKHQIWTEQQLKAFRRGRQGWARTRHICADIFQQVDV
jgi:hypothetical protein